MKYQQFTGLALLSLLFFVWPVADSIALRELLLLSSLLLFTWIAWRQRPIGGLKPLAFPLACYAALSLWLILVALFISDETAWSLGEFRSQWLNGMIALLAGSAAAMALRRDERAVSLGLTMFALALAAFVLVADVVAIAGPAESGIVARRMHVLGSGPDKANAVTNLLLAFLLAEIYLRLVFQRHLLRLHPAIIAGLLAMALFSEYAEGMRNGVIEFGLMLLFLAILLLRDRFRRFRAGAVFAGVAALLATAALFAYLSYSSDARWRVISETAEIAWHSDANAAWLEPKGAQMPRLGDGTPVDDSAYLRITALKEGGLLVIEHPLGIGFGRNAYGHGLTAKYGKGGLGHSHSGLMDLAIGAGIPGVLLWLAMLAALFLIAWRRYRAAPAYAPLLLMLVVGGYTVRMCVDSIVRDHMLQQFLLLGALLAVITVSQRGPHGSAPS